MPDDATIDRLFQQAVAAIDAGNLDELHRMLDTSPWLARERLRQSGDWLRNVVGNALDSFFKDPYLLWFVAEDPVRNRRLPPNITSIAQAIIHAAKRESQQTALEQLAYALRLVCWSWIARESAVQIPLIDVMLQHGASLDGISTYGGRYGSHVDAALYNKNFAAAEHLLHRGAPVTLSSALCLNRWDDARRLFNSSTINDQQDAFVLAAMHGNAQAIRAMLSLGIEPSTRSKQNQSHATALHHAVWSGSLETVSVLVQAGASLDQRDTIYQATPLGWARYAASSQQDARLQQYTQIAAYLQALNAPE